MPEPIAEANCVSTLILWWRTPRIRLIKSGLVAARAGVNSGARFQHQCQCQILGEGIGFLPDYMVRER